MPYDFDTVIDRRQSDSLKWRKYAGRDVLPLWVADMDFASPPEVVAALQARVAHGVFGYADATEEVVGAILVALQRDYGWQVDPHWLIPLPGLVSGLNIACRAIGQPGDGIITAIPVYPPFLSAPTNSERQTLPVPLKQEDGRWLWDFAALEAAITVTTKGLLLCHPHNPVGRAWTHDELMALADFARHHNLVVISDEIHCELLLEPGLRHTPFALLSPETAARTITLMAPSKTYNVPGLGCGFAIISDPELRQQFRLAMQGIVPHNNALSYVAAAAAYRDGAAWRSELLSYLRGNRDRVLQALDGVAGLKVSPVEATYLAWIDCRDAGIHNPVQFFEQAGVGLSNGMEFGAPGFVRLNFGCPRATLDEALVRMHKALGV